MACEEHGELANDDVFDDCCVICQQDRIRELDRLLLSHNAQVQELKDCIDNMVSGNTGDFDMKDS